MVWNLALMWAVVIVTLVLFLRSERRRRRDADIARAARFYAQARPLPRAPRPEEAPLPARRTGGLTEQQRAFLTSMAQVRRVNRAPAHPAVPASGR